MKHTYISPDTRLFCIESEGVFLGNTGVSVQVDEVVSIGYDSDNTDGTSDYFIDFD